MDRYVTGEARKELAGKLARSGIVMLKNEQRALPLAEGTKVALFGRTQNHTVFGGAGSGASQGCQAQEVDAALEEAGFRLEPVLHRFYTAEKARELREAENSGGFDFSKLEGLVNSGLIYEIFGKYQPTPTENEIGEELIAGRPPGRIRRSMCWAEAPAGRSVTAALRMTMPSPKGKSA